MAGRSVTLEDDVRLGNVGVVGIQLVQQDVTVRGRKRNKACVSTQTNHRWVGIASTMNIWAFTRTAKWGNLVNGIRDKSLRLKSMNEQNTPSSFLLTVPMR